MIPHKLGAERRFYLTCFISLLDAGRRRSCISELRGRVCYIGDAQLDERHDRRKVGWGNVSAVVRLHDYNRGSRQLKSSQDQFVFGSHLEVRSESLGTSRTQPMLWTLTVRHAGLPVTHLGLGHAECPELTRDCEAPRPPNGTTHRTDNHACARTPQCATQALHATDYACVVQCVPVRLSSETLKLSHLLWFRTR